MHTTELPHNHHDTKFSQKILDSMPDDNTISDVADAMKQLGDPTRLKIFWILCHTEECVINIASIIAMSPSVVSHHLRLLRIGGLIVSRRDGKEMYYKAASSEMVDIIHESIESIAAIQCPEFAIHHNQ